MMRKQQPIALVMIAAGMVSIGVALLVVPAIHQRSLTSLSAVSGGLVMCLVSAALLLARPVRQRRADTAANVPADATTVAALDEPTDPQVLVDPVDAAKMTEASRLADTLPHDIWVREFPSGRPTGSELALVVPLTTWAQPTGDLAPWLGALIQRCLSGDAPIGFLIPEGLLHHVSVRQPQVRLYPVSVGYPRAHAIPVHVTTPVDGQGLGDLRDVLDELWGDLLHAAGAVETEWWPDVVGEVGALHFRVRLVGQASPLAATGIVLLDASQSPIAIAGGQASCAVVDRRTWPYPIALGPEFVVPLAEAGFAARLIEAIS
jgi:hypothetical protein